MLRVHREPVWSGVLTASLADRIPATSRPLAIAAIKAFHSVAFFSIAALIVLFTLDGVRGRASRRTTVAATIAIAEIGRLRQQQPGLSADATRRGAWGRTRDCQRHLPARVAEPARAADLRIAAPRWADPADPSPGHPTMPLKPGHTSNGRRWEGRGRRDVSPDGSAEATRTANAGDRLATSPGCAAGWLIVPNLEPLVAHRPLVTGEQIHT